MKMLKPAKKTDHPALSMLVFQWYTENKMISSQNTREELVQGEQTSLHCPNRVSLHLLQDVLTW